MSDVVGTHNDLHSEQGARAGEHPGRARNPVIKVADIAWLEFEKPDLSRAEAFAQAFGFTTAARTRDEVQLRGTDPGAPCVILRRGVRSRFVGIAFAAQDEVDVLRIADATGISVHALPESIGGVSADLVDPSGIPVKVVAGMHPLPALPSQQEHVFNFGDRVARANATQRPSRSPAKVQRLGHVVISSTRYTEALNWYLDNLGMIVSDFLYYPGQRDRGPVMSFMRCDRGAAPADHHTLAMTLGPVNRYVHSAYQVCDLDAIGAGHRYLTERGYKHSWGIGRHIQGSQIFDYWRDPDGFLVEHFSDGDLFDSSLEPGWAPMTATGLAQWGPPVSKDFLGLAPGKDALHELRSIISALHRDNEFDPERLRGLLKVASS